MSMCISPGLARIKSKVGIGIFPALVRGILPPAFSLALALVGCQSAGLFWLALICSSAL